MCETNFNEKLNAVPVMLTRYDLNYYVDNFKDCGSLTKAMEMLRCWYIIDDLNRSILTKWQSML